jgi:hypothetical protein
MGAFHVNKYRFHSGARSVLATRVHDSPHPTVAGHGRADYCTFSQRQIVHDDVHRACLRLARERQIIIRHNVPGSIVECGVWKGGSMMAVAKTLLELETERDL